VNLREGTRRLALLLGVVGALAGGFASNVYLQTTLEQRTRHNRFEQLATANVVQRQRKFLQKSPDFIPGPYPMIAKQFGQKFKSQFPEYKDIDDEAIAKKVVTKYPQYRDLVVPWDQPWEKPQEQTSKTLTFEQAVQNATPKAMDTSSMEAWQAGEPFKVGKDGIKTVNWTSDFNIESIETEDGQTLYPTPAPAAWEYLLIALAPILGFIIPWGTVRAIGWVVSGFTASPK